MIHATPPDRADGEHFVLGQSARSPGRERENTPFGVAAAPRSDASRRPPAAPRNDREADDPAADTMVVVSGVGFACAGGGNAGPVPGDRGDTRMATLPTQFTKAKTNVEPDKADKENAAAAHADVRAHLEGDSTLKDYGIDTVLIGSYKRQVSIKRVKDVDVLSKLPDLPDDEDVSDLMDHLIEVLQNAYDQEGADPRVEPQDSSIKVEFPNFDLHVDVVPARPAGDYLEIPDREGGWMETNPEELTALSSNMNERYNDDYVPVVKLIRQARRTNLGKRPGGLFFEILTYHAFDDGLDDSSVAALFTGALRSIATQLAAVVAGGEVDDPTRSGEVISVRVTEAQMQNAASTFADLAQKAEDALANPDNCPAAKAYREILGKNDDGDWVFEMPATCNDDGTPKQVALIKGDRHVPAGDSRFA